jgi:hypothetical protein
LLEAEDEVTMPLPLGVTDLCWLRLGGGLKAGLDDGGAAVFEVLGSLEEASERSGEVSGLDLRLLEELVDDMEEVLVEFGIKETGVE